jgi:hypothetical protein
MSKGKGPIEVKNVCKIPFALFIAASAYELFECRNLWSMTELHNPFALDFSILIDLLVSSYIHISLYKNRHPLLRRLPSLYPNFLPSFILQK